MKVLLALLVAVSSYAATIRGTVVDPGDRALPGAKIRLLNASSRKRLTLTAANNQGVFAVDAAVGGKYAVAVSFPGFLERLIPVEVLSDSVELGKIVLALAGCEAPGVMCEDLSPILVGSAPPSPAARDMVLGTDCAIDADSLKMICGDPADPGKTADIRVRFRADQIWFEAVNGGSLAEPVGVNSSCGVPVPEVRIDGLGRGTLYCITTNRHRKSQIYLLDEVPPNAGYIPLHLVTWP